MDEMTKEQYLKDEIQNQIDSMVRIGKGLNFSETQVKKIYQDIIN